LQLLDTYPELAKYVERDSATGQLNITQEGIDALTKQAENQLDAAKMSQYAATVRVRKAENESNTTDLGRTIADDAGITKWEGNAVGQAALAVFDANKDILDKQYEDLTEAEKQAI